VLELFEAHHNVDNPAAVANMMGLQVTVILLHCLLYKSFLHFIERFTFFPMLHVAGILWAPIPFLGGGRRGVFLNSRHGAGSIDI